MNLKVLGSGSSGNCYILESSTEALIIEAGIPFMEVKKALSFNVKKIVGVIVSHAHKDHSGYIEQYFGICPIYKPYEVMAPYERFGNFFIKPFALVHDVECYGFYIEHPDIGKLIYATDTEYIKYRFNNINHILVEANYSNGLIEHNAINREHVLRGHMSLQTALTFISTNDNPALINVVLIHLSASNSDANDFLQKTKEKIKYGADCYIADKGLSINLDLLPF